MLCGAHRRPPPNYLSLACRALEEVIRIDNRLRPFLAQQREAVEQWLRDQEIEAAVRKVYGDAGADTPPSRLSRFAYVLPTEAELLKEAAALEKTRQVLNQLQAKLNKR
jgi:hypothetical protein